MQNSFTKTSYDAFLRFIEALKANNAFEKFDDEKIREIVREELALLHGGTGLRVNPSETQNEVDFIPFTKWNTPAQVNRFYHQFTIDGFLQSDKFDFKKPLFIQTDSQAKKVIWLHTTIELIYTFDKLIYQYSAIPLPNALYILIAENVLIKKKHSKKTVPPNPFSLETFHGRIRKSKVSYPDIDAALRIVFQKES